MSEIERRIVLIYKFTVRIKAVFIKRNIECKAQTSWTSSPVENLLSHPSSSFSIAMVTEAKYVRLLQHQLVWYTVASGV
jgi:hypothetical protein